MNKNQEIIYDNGDYRVEKISIPVDSETIQYTYGVYSNTYEVLEATTPVLAKALHACDEFSAGVNSFFQNKANEAAIRRSKGDSVIATG